MLCPILAVSMVLTVSAPTNEYNVRTAAGNPGYPVKVFCFINAAIGSTAVGNPAITNGTGWAAGSLVYIKNTNTITGKFGAAGGGGSPGAGGYGSNGTAGGTGGAGGNGGTSFAISANTGTVTVIDNGPGTLTGGTAGCGWWRRRWRRRRRNSCRLQRLRLRMLQLLMRQGRY